MTRYAWLQKHPTPVARDGAFHWYPATDDDRDVRASFAARLPSATGVLWELAPGRVAWAHTFVATAPSDNRRYTGLALAIVDGDESPATLLAQLAPPIATPWAETASASGPTARLAPRAELPDPAAVARALLDGGSASIGDIAHRGLPRAIAAIERAMPAYVTAQPRRGAWLAGDAAPIDDRVAALAVAAPASNAARAWRLACELASVDCTVDAIVAASAAFAPAGDFVATLNAWGRGKLARDVDELAERVALRVLARLIADRDPTSAIAEARWHALLPAARRTELLGAVARRAATLRGLIHG
jgi:hypothetical protein